jgi:hypothetical protein
MPDVPQKPAEILDVGAARARIVAGELERLRKDLERNVRPGVLTAEAREEGLSLLAAAARALSALPDLMNRNTPSEIVRHD